MIFIGEYDLREHFSGDLAFWNFFSTRHDFALLGDLVMSAFFAELNMDFSLKNNIIETYFFLF